MAFLSKGFLKSAHRRNELRAGIDLSVAAIFSFFLLVMFMVLPQPEPRIAVDLVVSRHSHYLPAAMRDDAIKVILTRDGSVFFGNSKIHPDDLPDRIRDAVRNGAEKRIYLELDARARYGDINALLPQIQRSGIENVSILAYSHYRAAAPSSPPTR
jgi:biopolymer transport protein ExbD